MTTRHSPNHHPPPPSQCWSPPGKSICNGQKMPRGPTGEPRKCVEDTGVGTGNCYFVDSTHSNNWRLLRIMSDQVWVGEGLLGLECVCTEKRG